MRPVPPPPDSGQVRFMAECVPCASTWGFGTYEERAHFVGQHRVNTGHNVRMWLQKPEGA